MRKLLVPSPLNDISSFNNIYKLETITLLFIVLFSYEALEFINNCNNFYYDNHIMIQCSSNPYSILTKKTKTPPSHQVNCFSDGVSYSSMLPILKHKRTGKGGENPFRKIRFLVSRFSPGRYTRYFLKFNFSEASMILGFCRNDTEIGVKSMI